MDISLKRIILDFTFFTSIIHDNIKLLVYGNVIEVRRWYGIKKKFNVKSICNIIFEKSHNEIVSIQIITENSNDKFFDGKVNFERLKEYLIHNVEKDKIKCYLLGTKKEMSI